MDSIKHRYINNADGWILQFRPRQDKYIDDETEGRLFNSGQVGESTRAYFFQWSGIDGEFNDELKRIRAIAEKSDAGQMDPASIAKAKSMLEIYQVMIQRDSGDLKGYIKSRLQLMHKFQ